MRFPIFLPIYRGSGSGVSIPADATLFDIIGVFIRGGFIVLITLVILTPFAIAFLKFMDFITDKYL